MREYDFLVLENQRLAENTWLLRLSGRTAETAKPGQFVNLRLAGFYLRRPLSVCDATDEVLTLIYKVVGQGTAALAALRTGETVNALAWLGNGFQPDNGGERPLLLGGGAGIAPLYLLAKTLRRRGGQVTAILGVNRASELFYQAEFQALGVKTLVATADGSCGVRGFVTDAMPLAGDYSYTYACGPEPMLRAVYQAAVTGGEYSFEERMGCGFGACMGCTCQTLYGPKRICRDGPVLRKEEIRWPT